MYLKINEIANELRVTRKTVYTLINEGGLDRYISRVGGRFCITPERLKQFVDDCIVTKD